MTEPTARAASGEPPATATVAERSPIDIPHVRISSAPPPLAMRVRELWRARDLFLLLVARESRVRYRQTALGLAWVVLQPLVPALIVSVVLGSFARLPSGGTPYVLFALAGFVLFGLFAGAVNRASTSFLRDGQLVTRIYFPRSILPLASGSVAVWDFAIGLALVVGIGVALGRPVGVSLLAIPFLALLTLVLGLAVGMALAAVSAHYRDATLAVPFGLQLLLYTSPVLYSAELVPPSLRSIYVLNPLVTLVESFRAAVLGTPWPAAQEIATSAAVGLAVTLVALAIFSRASRDLADVV